MARRHPQKGCHCTTCTNERAYNKRIADEKNAKLREWRRSMDEIRRAHHDAKKRAWRRRRADRRDAQRLEQLQKGGAT